MVDRADRGMADHNVATRSSRWVMAVVFWCINAVLWNVWVAARFYMDSDGGRYSEYKGKRQKLYLLALLLLIQKTYHDTKIGFLVVID